MQHMVGNEIRIRGGAIYDARDYSQSDFWWTVGTILLGVFFIGFLIWRLSHGEPVTV